jgi:hypothetical protein
MSNIIVSPTSGVIEFNTGDASGASFYTSTAPIRLDSTGGNSWLTGTNVGIGITDPDTPLHIKGNIRAEATASTSFADFKSSQIWAGSTYDIIVGTSNPLFFRTNDTRRMTIAGGGDVGVGTTNPLYKLDVSGTIAGASGNFVSGITIGGNPVMTGTSDTDVDTLQTVTDRGNVTTTSISSLGQYISGGSGVFTRADIGSVDIFGDAIYVGEVRVNSLSDKVSNGNAQINFGGASKTIEFETAATARMFIASGGNVGIGTNNPTNTLDVWGPFIRLRSSNVDSELVLSASDSLVNNSILKFGDNNSSSIGQIKYAHDGDSMSFVTSGEARMFISGDGRVGVGTIRPTNNFHVRSESDGDWVARISNSEATAGRSYGLKVDGGSNSADIGFEVANYNGDVGLRVRGDANVGIGTYDIDQALSLSGAIDFQAKAYTQNAATMGLYTNNVLYVKGGTAGLMLQNGDGSDQIAMLGSYMAFVNNSSETMRLTHGGDVGIGTNNPTAKLTVDGESSSRGIELRRSSIFDTGNVAMRMVGLSGSPAFGFHVSDVERMRITNAGNVGIGTDDPASPLSVVGTARIDGSDGDAVLTIANSAGSQSLRIDQNSLRTTTTNDLTLFTDGNTSQLVLDQGGNVGIGTAAPSEKLHVEGNIEINAGDLNTNTGQLGFATQYDTAYLRSSYVDPSAKTETYLAFHANTNGAANGTVAEQMRIQGSNVGIGTTNPTEPLTVKGSIVATNTSNVTIGGITFSSNDGRLFASQSDGTAKVLLDSNGVSYLNGGNVGIGSQAPTQKLDVAGAINIQDGYSLRYNDSSNISIVGSSSLGLTSTALNHHFKAYDGVSSYSEYMTIATGGNVGIGSASPSTQLDVVGTGAFKRINIYDTTYNANPRLCVGRWEEEDLKFYVDDMNIKITAVQDTDGDGDHRFILDREFQGTGVNSFHIANSGNYQLTIDKDNKVGMGVNNPSDFNSEANRLVIGDGAGSEGMTVYAGTSNSASVFFADGTAGNTAYAGYVQYRHANDRLDFGAGGGTRMSVNGNGAGIGTYSPDAKLDVSGAYSDSLAIFRNGPDNVKVEINDDADIQTSGWISSHNTGTSRIFTSEIAGDAASNALVMETDGAGNRTRLYNYGTSTDFLIESKGSSSDIRINAREAIRFYTSGSASAYSYGGQRMTITEAGNVGIGSATPRVALDVNGEIRNLAKVSRNYRVSMGTTTLYVGTVDLTGNGDGAGFKIKVYDPAEKVWRLIHVTIQNSGGTNYTSVTVEGGGEDTEVHIDLLYKNRDGDATKTDFFLDPTASKSFTQYVYVEGYIVTDTGYNDTSATSVDLDVEVALYQTDAADGSNVGIGTVNPLAKLHVSGSVMVDSNQGNGGLYVTRQQYLNEALKISTDDEGSYFTIIQDESSAGFGKMVFQADADHEHGYFGYEISGAEQMRLNITGLGIGVTDPDQKLDVNGNIRIPNQGKIVFGSAGTPSDYLQLYDVGAGNPLLKLVQDTNTRFTIEGANGNVYMQGDVGIGETDPDEKLEVAGNILAKDSAVIAGLQQTGGYIFHDFGTGWGYKASTSASRLGIFTDNAERLTIASNGKIGIGITAPVKELQVNGTILGKNNGGYTQYDAQGNVATVLNLTTANELNIGQAIHVDSMSFNVGGTDDAIFINSSADVGIGTASPSHKLNVAVTDSDDGIILQKSGSSNDIFRVTMDGTNDQGEMFLYDGGEIEFAIRANTNASYINTPANFGIGTNAPAYKLDIQDAAAEIAQIKRTNGGNCEFLINPVGGDAKVVFQNSGTDIWAIGKDNSDSSFRISEGGALETNPRFIVDNGGNVGIGTTNPEDLLTISAGAGGSTTDLINVGGTGNGRILVRHIDGKDSVSAATGPLFLNYGISQNVSLAYGGGNVGVGSTSNPQALLHVHKSNTVGPTIELSNSEYRAYINSWGSTATAGRRDRFEINASAADFAVAGDSIRFQIGSAGDSYEKVRIDQSGQVGIGSATPRHELDVSGIISQCTTTVNSLPTVGTSVGARSMVTDSQIAASNNFGASIAGYGGGSYIVPVWCDGSYWYIG